MFLSRKKKSEKSQKPVLTPKEMAEKIAATAGLLPDELLKLLDSLAKVEEDREVIRQKLENNKLGKRVRMSLSEAVELAQKRLEESKEREEIRKRVLKKHHLKFVEPLSRDVIEEGDYPTRLSPQDMERSIQAAKVKLVEEDAKQTQKTFVQGKSNLILHVLDRVKSNEAIRIARMIARRQERIGLEENISHAGKNSNAPDIPTENKEEMTPDEIAQRSLDGFGKGLNTLVDDAAEVVKTDYDAAASVMRQWVGTIQDEK